MTTSPKLGIPITELIDSSVEEVVEVSENSLETSASKPSEKTSIQKYEEEWQSLYEVEDANLTKLKSRALDGSLRACKFRSVCWRLLLGALPPAAPGEWLLEIQTTRNQYKNIKNNLTINPREKHAPVAVDNPLSTATQSSWNKFFCDKELRAVIEQDVVRTFPGVDFFRNKSVQAAMTNVLFCYARENPEMCYRQGMHEILAPLIFVLHYDHQALLHTKELDPVNEVICEMLDEKYIEEDSYVLFEKVMSAIQGSYQINDLTPLSTGYFPTQSPTKSPASENQVLTQLEIIKEHLFSKADPELYDYLTSLEISLPLFGIRWLRLLFGREFPLHDLLVLWDAIFAEGNKFDLVDYIVVAMLMAVRNQLLESDYTSCLTLLMHYPATMDVNIIIEQARYLKNPKAFKGNLPKVIANQPDLQDYYEFNKLQLDPSGRNCKNTTSKKSMIQRYEKNMKTRGLPEVHLRPKRNNSAVVDGYKLEDPALMQAKLEHAHTVMSLCRLKLNHYYLILEKSIPEEDIDAQQALTGIHGLCSLLDPICITSPTPSVEVETAFEAGESNRTSVASPIESPTSNVTMKLPPPKSNVAMKVFKETKNKPIEATDKFRTILR